jgi:cytochrome c peroxidase
MTPTPTGRQVRLASLAFMMTVAACDRAPMDAASPLEPSTALEAKTPDQANRAVLAQLGERIFNDPNLSLRHNQSCASCHDVAWGFSSPNAGINQTGAVMFGSVSNRFGTRKPPSAAYATQSPVMFFDEEDDTFVGGSFWDGRATGARLGKPAAEQALFPFVNPVEQALPDEACVMFRIATGTYRGLFTGAWGRDLATIRWPHNTAALCEREGTTIPLTPEERALVKQDYDRVGYAVAAFEESPTVNQFSSKYDASLRHEAVLTDDERRGLVLFEGKAGCAGCHPSNGANALFTDYTYDNIGVPANPQNPALPTNPLFADLGIGGFLSDPSRDGAQKVPTLRNIDRRGVPGGAKAYMHNGVFKSLEQVVHFYNTRDVLPGCATVSAPKFAVNCWPAPEIPRNVNMDELGNLQLTPVEERLVVAYLRTLSDGWSPSQKARD